MLAVFMALSPRDRPRYYMEKSVMKTRSNPLSPGLGFRPQPNVLKNLISVNKNPAKDDVNAYVKNLDQYLQIYYWKQNKVVKQENDDANDDSDDSYALVQKFVINRPGDCTPEKEYGFASGKPCVLVKMNKIYGFEPKPGVSVHEKGAFANANCTHNSKSVAVHCSGEYLADIDNIGPIHYRSESGPSDQCGALETKWFPYKGKSNRQDVYQAPYIWVQFTKPKPNVLINVLCRVFGQNIDFDKKAGRALTRFQIYVEDLPVSSRKAGEV
jgi:sodium/potassium-transporting ATPase subunit beta